MSPMLRLLVIGLATCVTLYAAAVAVMYLAQGKLLFPGAGRGELAATSPVGRWVEIPTPDGERLTGMYVPPQPGKPVVIYFHGNGNNIQQYAFLAEAFGKTGYGYLGPSYRGYPGSTGTTDETGILTDGLAAYDWLRRELPDVPVMVAAHSLGTGVAVNTAAEREVKAVALLSPYDSIENVAAYNYPWLPVRPLIQNPIRSWQRIARVSAPKILIHGDLDDLIAIARGEALFAAAPEPKTFITARGLGHNNMWTQENFDAVLKFFEAAK